MVLQQHGQAVEVDRLHDLVGNDDAPHPVTGTDAGLEHIGKADAPGAGGQLAGVELW